jgi:hypothetical protein
VTDVEPVLARELEALAPLEQTGGSWDEVARRAGLGLPGRRRGRPLVLLVAGLVAALGVGTAANAAFGWRVSPFWAWVSSYPPGRIGPIVTVFSGRGWNLVAWKSTKGVCTSYGAPGASASGCHPLAQQPLTVDFSADLRGSRERIAGNVAPSVVRVVVVALRGRSFAATISRPLPQLGTARRFFVAEGRVPFVRDRDGIRVARLTVLAYDAHGTILGRFG